MKNLCFLFIFLLLSGSCSTNDDTPECDIFPAPNFEITLQDAAGNPLIGTEYLQDSFKLSTNTSVQYLKPIRFGSQENLAIWFPDITSGIEYFLELSETDADTLKVDYLLNDEPCSNGFIFDRFTYNQEVLYENEGLSAGVIVILKD